MISKGVIRYCKEYWEIENYELAIADDVRVWDCHHRLEIQEDKIMSQQDLLDAGLLWNRPASELIFLTRAEHTRLHKTTGNFKQETLDKTKASLKGHTPWNKGEKMSDESRKKMSDAWIKRREIPISEDTRKKMSLAHKGRTYSPLAKCKYIDEEGTIHMMDASNAKRWHPDWKLIEQQ